MSIKSDFLDWLATVILTAFATVLFGAVLYGIYLLGKAALIPIGIISVVWAINRVCEAGDRP